MWIFGQVWFACLVGFVVGVVLDWVVRVRPQNNRVAELEARLAANARSARQDGEYGRSVFDRGAFASAGMTSDGFVSNRNRGGLLTPSVGASLATDLLDERDDEKSVPSGVEDFPGVARLSEAWEDEAEEATRAAPEPWQPIGPAASEAERSWATEPEPEPAQSWMSAPDEPVDDHSADVTSVQEPVEPPTSPTSRLAGSDLTDQGGTELAELPPVEPSDAAADAQYLEFLRAGANHAPTSVDADADADAETTSGDMFADAGPATDEHPQAVAEPGSAEVTSVLPQIEGYEAYESYADEYEQNGYHRNGYAEDDGPGYQYGEYQPEEVAEPMESSTPLPRRGAGEASVRFAPFEIPFEQRESGSEFADAHQRPGDMTPIQDGGFQPFEKPPIEEGYQATNGAWSDSEPANTGYDLSGGQSDTYQPTAAELDDPSSSWFDLSDRNPAVEGTLTQRMLPVSRPDLDHPDLLRDSVFGGEQDNGYHEAEGTRSLFEPVIQADSLEDGYLAPAYEGTPEYERFDEQVLEQQPAQVEPEYQQYQPEYAEQGEYQPQADSQEYQQGEFQPEGEYQQEYEPQAEYQPQQPSVHSAESAAETTIAEPADEFYGEQQPPRPVRVRTGIDATRSVPAMPPVPEPAETAGQPAPGPFGPGSALPAPDGSAPADGFTVKARTSSMVFHTESSPFYDRLEPQVWFRNAEDAQRAGFTSWERPRTW